MSAIAGILYFGGAPAEPGWVEKLTDVMKPCGPDERTHWRRGPIALGHCMLRTTPESMVERQPLANPDETVILVWDGRLDNREELQHELAAAGVALRDESDAELVLQSYMAWGEQCPERLLGDFAFAIWDERHSRLFCARDHMGVRPFFYTRTDRFFAFASEDEALAHLPGVSRALSEQRIAYFLAPSYLGFDYTRSWLKDISAISAAQSMSLSTDGTERAHMYWELQTGEEADYASDAECEEAFLRVFGEAVRCRMRTTGDIAAMISGGLDSASIAAMVKQLLPGLAGKGFHSYSAISDQPQTCPESRSILSLTQDLGGNAHYVSVPSFTGMLTVQDLIEAGWSKPHPVDNSILLPAMMCLAAGRAGHRVMLTGVCGDLTTHGCYSYIVALAKAKQWRPAWRESHAASLNHTYLQGTAPAWIFLRSLYQAFAPVGIKRFARKVPFLMNRSHPKGRLISPALARKIGLAEWHTQRDRHLQPFLTDIQRAHILSMQPPQGIASSMGGYNRVAGKFGVELRDPWADRRVAEFWARLPLKYKFRSGWTKYLVRSTLGADLPAEVVWRVGKEHVGWNMYYRLMDETATFIADTVEHHLSDVDNYVNTKAARQEYAAYLATKGHDQRSNVFDLVTLVSWVRRTRAADCL